MFCKWFTKNKLEQIIWYENGLKLVYYENSLKMVCSEYALKMIYCENIIVGWLFGFHSISTFVGYLIPNSFLYKNQFYFKQFSLA